MSIFIEEGMPIIVDGGEEGRIPIEILPPSPVETLPLPTQPVAPPSSGVSATVPVELYPVLPAPTRIVPTDDGESVRTGIITGGGGAVLPTSSTPIAPPPPPEPLPAVTVKKEVEQFNCITGTPWKNPITGEWVCLQDYPDEGMPIPAPAPVETKKTDTGIFSRFTQKPVEKSGECNCLVGEAYIDPLTGECRCRQQESVSTLPVRTDGTPAIIPVPTLIPQPVGRGITPKPIERTMDTPVVSAGKKEVLDLSNIPSPTKKTEVEAEIEETVSAGKGSGGGLGLLLIAGVVGFLLLRKK